MDQKSLDQKSPDQKIISQHLYPFNLPTVFWGNLKVIESVHNDQFQPQKSSDRTIPVGRLAHVNVKLHF